MTGTRQKILLINQTFYPDKAATAQHLTDLAEELAGSGHDVTVLTGRRGYVDPSLVYPRRELRLGIQIVRVWPFSFGKKSRALRILDGICLNICFALKFIFLPRYDQVVVLTSPPLVAAAAAFYACWKKTKLTYWVMDLNPDEAVQAGWIKKGSITEAFLSAALEFALHRSDLIIVLDDYMSARIQKRGIGAGRIKVIPPWPLDKDLEYIPKEKNLFLKEHKLEHKFIVMYSGNFSICHPLTTLLETALELRTEPDIVFLFIGGGARLREVLEFKERHSLENIVYLPYVPRTQLKYSLSAADLHAVVMGDPFVGIVHPCKIYSVLRLGIPFIYIGPKESHVGDLIKGDWQGYEARHGESKKLAGQILELKRQGVKHRAISCERDFPYSRKKLLGNLMKHLTSPTSEDLTAS